MLTETQLTEIRNYLFSKKLPIDILIEINDHFCFSNFRFTERRKFGFC